MIRSPSDPAGNLDRHADQHENEFEEFDIWCEQHYELMEQGDYPALAEHCRRWAAKYPDDPYAKIMLGQAYVLNGECQKAIGLLAPPHRQDPLNTGYHYALLDALFAMGKSEDDFEWAERPQILRMSDSTLDFCFNFLRLKKKPRTVSELHNEFIPRGYLLFFEKDLLSALLGDERFLVTNAHRGPFAEVQVVRKARKTRGT